MATARKVKKKAVKKVPARKKAARKKKGTKKATKSNAVQRLPKRSEVPVVDRWDLKSLFTGDKAWETAFKKWDKQIDGYKKYQGKLAKSAATLAACLQFDSDFDRAGERLAYYAHLKTAEDSTNGTYQTMMGRYMSVASRAAQAASFIRPEILSIPATKLKKFMANKAMEPWRLAVDRLTRYKPHTLSEGEEKLLAMQIEMAQTSSHTYDQLHDSDMKFDVIRDDKGNQVELGHGTFGKFMESPKRSVRANAYEKYYGKFSDVQHTMAATLSGSIQKDIYYARARNYESALEKALFADRVPTDVYNNLISTVGDNLKALHKYYRLRNRVLKLKKFSLYDQYVSLLPKARMTHTWDEAVEVVLESLKPLGAEYGRTLKRGLTGRWCDRYPNQGKSSGAFSAGSFDGDPFILMNFKPEVLNDVFTLTHEAGHSMHSYYSSKTQPFQYYNYTIFVAEVASTFNEQLLTRHLLSQVTNKTQRAMLINREIDNIRGTIYRQTMFSEFEQLTHALAEQGQPLTIDAFKKIYGELLRKYLGPTLDIDDFALLECLRIPHFYRAFYVYKYATGMSAAIALCRRVTEGGEKELADYLNFLTTGCSKYPLELLKDAGVDMTKPAPIAAAMEYFSELVDELGKLI